MDKEYILKHKDKAIMVFKLNDDFELSEVGEVINEEGLPFGIKYKGKEKAQFIQLSDWIKNRGLPRERSDLANIELDMNANSVALSLGSYALNLTDHYWVHKSDVDLKWGDVNFFENEFKEVINFDFTGVYESNRNIVVAPDLTVDGSLRKKWIISGGERFLLKGSRYDEMQEPFNEAIGSEIMKLLNIEHVEYGLVRNKSDNMPLSICKCMVNKDTEYITALVVRDTELKNERNEYERFTQICKKKGIENAEAKIDDMIILDFIMGNTDRHMGNFGIIRNANNLEWLNVAPLFDSGNSLCHHVNRIDSVEENLNSRCRWFEGGNYQKLDYIHYPWWYSKNKMKDIGSIVYDGLKQNDKTSKDKKSKLVSIIEERVKIFDNIINKKSDKLIIMGKSFEA